MKPRFVLLFGFMLTAALIISLQSVAEAGPKPAASPSQKKIRINEYMASNSTVLEDPDEPNEFPDWIELYNPTLDDVSLDGLYLIKGDLADPVRFAISDGLSIPAQGFIIFYADDDPSQGKQHTNFRLTKEGDQLGLYGDLDATETIDTVAFGPQTTDYSEGREVDGGPTLKQYDRPTPGRTNSLLPPLISDVMHSPELPTSAEAVTVTAIISDDGEIVEASLIYSRTGLPGGTVLLPPFTVTMTLVSGNLYRAEIPRQPSGAIVYYHVNARDNDGQVVPNPDQVRIQSYRYPVDYVKPPLVINEVMADNKTALEDADDPGDYPDWIELFNAGSSEVSLDGLFLTDKMDNPTKFAITGGLTIDPGGYVIFYADERPEQGVDHTNFKLNDKGEKVALFGAEGSVELDRIDYGRLYANIGYGRYPNGPDGQQQILVCATPGKPNILCGYKAYLPVIPVQ